MTNIDDFIFCIGDLAGKPQELKIKPMQKQDPKTFHGEYDYTTGVIKLGISEEFTKAILVHEHMHKTLMETLEGTEAVIATVQYDIIKDMVDTFLNPELLFIPRLNYYSKNLLEEKIKNGKNHDQTKRRYLY